jgi:SPX domain protein involved in polyphosphate accumulation
MKFDDYYENNIVSEWKDFYINYPLLRQLLRLFEVKYRQAGNLKDKN